MMTPACDAVLLILAGGAQVLARGRSVVDNAIVDLFGVLEPDDERKLANPLRAELSAYRQAADGVMAVAPITHRRSRGLLHALRMAHIAGARPHSMTCSCVAATCSGVRLAERRSSCSQMARIRVVMWPCRMSSVDFKQATSRFPVIGVNASARRAQHRSREHTHRARTAERTRGLRLHAPRNRRYPCCASSGP